MQRRNFRIAGREFQQSNFRTHQPRLDLRRDYEHWVKGLRSVKEAPKETAAVEPKPGPEPDDKGRWHDDGGEGG